MSFKEYLNEATLKKAKKGDIVQSFDVGNPIDPTRGSVIGKVTKVEVDKKDGVEYVYLDVIAELRGGVITKIFQKKVRTPQVGTPIWPGSKTTDNLVKP